MQWNVLVVLFTPTLEHYFLMHGDVFRAWHAYFTRKVHMALRELVATDI
jgi:hypothetical protein